MPRIGVYATNGTKILELESAELVNNLDGEYPELGYTLIHYGDEKYEVYGTVITVVKSKREEY